MPQVSYVVVLEDDPYARDMIAMMLSRDWRTHVVGEFGCRNEAQLAQFLEQPASRVDVCIVDTEVPEDPAWPERVADMVRSLEKPPVVIYTCTQPKRRILENLLERGEGGYLVKGEILYAVASAVVLASRGHFVVTPGAQALVSGSLVLPKGTAVLNGMHPAADFTQRESDIARLGILFNLAQRDIADELVISTNWVAEAISNAYEKLNLREIVSGEIPLEAYFDDEVLLQRCRSIIERGGSQSRKTAKGGGGAGKTALRKAPWISTLAFHIITIPEVEQR
jgi:DNA-binding NarL/FixJ family response regulator